MNGTVKYSVGILAGGNSTRMGRNKALLEFESKTFLTRIIEEFKDHEIIISGSYDGEYNIPGIKEVSDENKDYGPVEGIRQILNNSSEEYVFICACDMPFIKDELASYISEFISSDYDCYVLTEEGSMHPLCAIYSKKILPVIERIIAQDEHRIRSILDNTRTKYIELGKTSFDRKLIRNVNTKDEYKALSLPVIFAVSGYKDSGKTWLITELINEFIKEDYTVGVIKHDGHDAIAEVPGTDTARFAETGALRTAVFSDSKYVISSAGTSSVEDLIRYMKQGENAPDIIILEGFKTSSYPKVLMVNEDQPMPAAVNVIMKVSCGNEIPGLHDRDDIDRIFCSIKKFFDL